MTLNSISKSENPLIALLVYEDALLAQRALEIYPSHPTVGFSLTLSGNPPIEDTNP